jgi:hypothetical protein
VTSSLLFNIAACAKEDACLVIKKEKKKKKKKGGLNPINNILINSLI